MLDDTFGNGPAIEPLFPIPYRRTLPFNYRKVVAGLVLVLGIFMVF